MASRRFSSPEARTTKRGEITRSLFEKVVCDDLTDRGVQYAYESESLEWFEKQVGTCAACDSKGETYASRWYTPDVDLGDRLFVEIKGKFTAKDRKIALGIREAHPDVEIRYLFQRDNKLSKASATRYSDWAEANGFKYAIGNQIPEEWIH